MENENNLDYNTLYNRLVDSSDSKLADKLINTTDKATQVYRDINWSYDKKLEQAQQSNLSKELDIAKYQDIILDSMSGDSDSGLLTIGGKQIPFRLAPNGPNFYDALDSKQVVDSSNKKSDVSRMRQYALVSELTGKPITELTDEDFRQVKNYQNQNFLQSITNKDHKFEAFDRTKVYDDVDLSTLGYATKAKIIGQDEHGRAIVDIINPLTGRSLAFELASNPYTNARFKLSDYENSRTNAKRLERWNRQHEPLFDALKDIQDNANITEGRLSQDLAIVKSTAYQMFGRILQYGPEGLVDKDKWTKIANSVTGQEAADFLAGVTTATRADYAADMQQFNDKWDRGDYIGSLRHAVSNIDRLLAESTPQMAAMAVGGATATMLGASGLGALAVGAMLAAVDQTASDVEEYKANNHGQMPSGKDIALQFAKQTAALGIEGATLGKVFGRFLPNQVGRAIRNEYKASPVANTIKGIGTSTVGESAQEGLQQAISDTFSQDQSKPLSFIDKLLSGETAKAAVLGGLMGGTMASTTGITLPVDIATSRRRDKQIEDNQKYIHEHTTSGSKADIKASEEAIKTVDAMSVDSSATDEQKIQAIRDLQQQSVNPSLNEEATKAIQRKQHELATDLVKSLQKLESAEAKEKAQEAFFKAMQDANITSLGSREALFGQLTYYSNYNARELFEQGNVASTEAREEAKKELLKIAKDLGVDEKTAVKTLEEVGEDVKYGPRGYYHYADKLHALIDSSRGNPNLSQGDKTKIQNEIDNTATRLVALLANQQNKLGDLVQAVETIAEGTKRNVPVKYRSGKGKFEVIGSQLANNSIDSDVGIYRLIKDLTTDIEAMQKILGDSTLLSPGKLQEIASEYNRKEDRKSPYENRKYGDSKATQSILARFRNAVTTIQKETKERYAKPKEGILGKFSNRGKQITPQNAAAMLDRLARGANESATTQLTQQIRNYLEYGSLEDLNKAIDNYYSKSKDKKEKVLAKLKEIQNLDTANKEAVSTREVANNDVFNRVNQELDNITSESIKKLTLEDGKKIDEIANTLTRLRREFKEVMTNSEQDKALLNRINKLATELQEHNAELGKENLRKHARELNKKATEEPNGGTLLSTTEAKEVENKIVSDITFNHPVEVSVVNIKKDKYGYTSRMLDEHTLYIYGGRTKNPAKDMPESMGNPYEMGNNESKRQEVIDKCWRNDKWLDTVRDNIQYIQQHPEITKVIFGCFCKPAACHLDKLPQLINAINAKSELAKTENNVEKSSNTPEMTTRSSEEVSSENSNTVAVENEKLEALEDTESTEIVPDKKSPVSGLLNNEINKSVDLFKDDPDRIDLNQQLRIGNADSKLAIDSTLYDNEFIKPNYGLSVSPQQIFEKMKFSFKGIVADKIAAYNYFRKTYKDMPQMLLLYNIVTGKAGKSKLDTIESIEYNEIVCRAIDFSAKEYFSSSLYKNLYRPETLPDERVCSIFGYNEATVTPKELRQLKKFIKEYGVPRAYIADMLGLTILRNLGIRPNDKTGDWGFYEKVATGLGLEALRYAEELGVVTNNEYNTKKNAKYDVINADLVRCIQISEANQSRINRISSIFNTREDKQTGEKITGLIETMKPDSDTRIDKGIRWGKPKRLSYKDKEGNIVDIPVYIKNTDDLVEVPPQARETLQDLHRQKFSLNRELIDILQQNRKAIEKKLGWKEKQEIEDLYFSRQSGQEAANQSIIEQLDALVDAAKEYDRRRHLVGKGAIDKGEGGIYFNWFMSRNGRYFIDSTGINPQTQKFQRFLLMPSAIYRDFDPNNEEHNELEAFAIAQAFDNIKHSNEEIAEIAKKVNALSLEELEQVQKDLLDPDLSEKAFSNKYKEIGLKGVENLAQCLNVLQHLKAKKKANGIVFKTWLAVENDSTTSGYAIRFANMPLKSQYKTMAKTGILVGDMLDKYAGKQIHEMKANKDDFHDLYEDTALDISHRIAELHPKQIDVVKEYFLEFLKKEKINRSSDTIDGLAQIWTDMYEALPRANEDGTVTGALRTLMKSPTMVFGYGGGIKGISENMSYEIMDEFVQTYVDVMRAGSVAEYLKNNPDADKAKIESIVKTLNSIGKYFVNSKGEELTFLEALKSKDIDRIWVRIGTANMTVEQLFYNIIRPTYGTAVDEALDVKFKEYKDINDVMSQAFVTIFGLFNNTLNTEIDRVLGEEGKITIAARNELIKSLKDLWPSIPTAYGATAEDGIMLLMKSRKMPYNSAYGVNRVKNFYFDKSDGKFKQETAYANMRVFDNTSRAGAVVPIHWLDGAIMSSVLKDHLDQGITPIHDALVMSALAASDATRTMNETILRINAEYDLLGTIQNRFFEVVKNYAQQKDANLDLSNLKGLPDLLNSDLNILNIPIRDNKGRIKYKYVDKEKVEITIRDFIETLYSQYKDVKAARDEFYSQVVGITNVDGPRNTQIVVKPDESMATKAKKVVEEAVPEWEETIGSSYRGYQTDEDIKETSEKIVTDVTARADFVEDLHNMSVKDGGLICSNEHISRLKDIITKVNPKELVNLVVQLTKDGKLPTGPSNAGRLDIKGDKFTIKLAKDNGFNNIDPITRQSVYSSMSMAEIYTHEVVHAGLHFAFQQHLNNNLKFSSEINQLLDLQRAAMDIITPMDFVPENYDKSLEDVYRKHAEATWNYIFDNKNKDTLEGLKEFCAYGLTDERIVNKLKTVKVPEKETKFRNVADKLLHIIKGIFDLIFKNKPIRDVFPLAHSIIRGNTSLRNRSIYAELENLTYKMSNADAKAARSLTMQLAKPFEQVCKAASIVQKFGNKYVGGFLDYVFNIADRKEWNRVTKYAQKIGDSRWDDAKLVASSLGLFLVSGHRRRVLKEWLTSVLKLSQQGAAMSIMNDILAPDMQTMRLDMLSMFYRTVDAAAKSQEAICYKELVEAFGGKLNELEETSLTRVGLMTDLQCLLDEDTSVSDVIKLVADDGARLEKIAEIKATLSKNKDYDWIVNQTLGLALYMTEGIGNEHQNLNSYNIASGMLSSTKVNISEKERVLIDKLATLYALDLLDSDHKKVFSSLKKEGIEAFLTTHKGFVKETLGGVKLDDGSVIHTVDQIHTVKGYTKSLFDTSYDVQVGFIEDRKDFESRGYELVTVLPHSKITDVRGQALYRRNWANPERRDGASYRIVGARAMGTSLKDTAYSVYDKIEPEHESLKPKDVWDTFYKRATKNGQRIERMMRKKELDVEELRKLSGGYTPIISPVGIPHDYRITMTYENKVNVLGMDTRGMTILSKMFATQHLKATAPAINKALTSFLVTNMEQNMNQYHKDINTGVKYVKIERNSPNEYLRNAWNVVPKELKDVAEDLPNGLWVRDDWLQSLFGVQNYSITETLPKDSFTKTKRMLSIAEYAMKTITYMVKRNIVLLIPRVLLGNVVSNANYSIMTGSNPVSVVRTTLANFRAIRDYMETKRELERIKFRERLGQATDKEIRSKNWLMTKLENNRVHPLMQKGMYQAIVEDINPDELESIGKVMKFLKNWKIADKIPSSAKWILKNLYMTEGTFVHDLMFTLTQYSDFAARATEYQLKLGKMTEGIPRYLDNGKENPKWREKEEALSMMIVRAFINYDKPQSRGEQYLNDIGLMMFTKFAKRIQSVVMHQLTKNPMGVLMFLGAQSMFLDTEDIIEQNALNKHWSALLHNPLANFIDATVPMPIQYYLGMRNL